MKKNIQKIEPYIWILPSIILMSVFILIPIGFVFRMALSKVTRAGLIKGFVGNRKRMIRGGKRQSKGGRIK